MITPNHVRITTNTLKVTILIPIYNDLTQSCSTKIHYQERNKLHPIPEIEKDSQ